MALVTAQQFDLQPNIQQSIQQGLATRQFTQEEANVQRLQEQAAQQGQTRRTALGVPEERPQGETQEQAELRLIANDPKVADDLLKVAGINSQSQREDAARFASQVINAQSEEQQIALINERALAIDARGGDSSNTRSMLEMSPEERVAASQGLETAALTAMQRATLKGQAARGQGGLTKAFGPVTLVNKDTDEKILVIPTFDPKTGEATLKEGAIPKGFELSRETGEEKRAADLLIAGEKAGATVTGKGIAQRRSAQIDAGITAADSMANLVRASDLLEKVKTGGVSAVAVRAKQLFGIEGADEGELSNRLSKAVLGQLRETFGAAFTEREGKRLERIEAGLGKSTAGNRRIIAQSMRMVKRAAQRGIRAAEAAGDKESAQDISEALAFSLDTDQPQGVNVGRFVVEVE